MAYRELFVVEVREVLRLWQAGRGYRTVASMLSMDRKTVRRYVEAAQAIGVARDVGWALTDEVISFVWGRVRPGAPDRPRALGHRQDPHEPPPAAPLPGPQRGTRPPSADGFA